jgi:protein-S-isoprenylcysteine O-methyltransferase Ste14
MSFYQIALPIGTLVYLLQVFVIKSYIQYKRTGVNPLVFGKSDTAHDYISKVYKAMIFGLLAAIEMYSFFPDYYQYIFPFWFMEYEVLQHIGAALVVISLVWVVISQNQMAKSWRIGINYEEKTELVTSGVFKISRNPVFLGILISYIGTFLIIPNAITFTVLVLTYVTLQFQIRLEEEYLLKSHRETYSQYSKKTRRWI